MNPIQLDYIFHGLSDLVKSHGFSNIEYDWVDQYHDMLYYSARINVSYTQGNGHTKTKLIVYAGKLYKLRPGTAPTERIVALAFLRHILPLTEPIYLEITNGKYKNSIAEFDPSYGLYLGENAINNPIYIPLLSSKNIKYLKGQHTPKLVVEEVNIISHDRFGNTNEIDDIIVFIENGRLSYGVYVGHDDFTRMIKIKCANSSGTYTVLLQPDRDMMNITKMPSSAAAQKILLAQLSSK